MNHLFLYVGCIGLTAITDNAALTYLGSQVPNLSEVSKQALVAGSVVGGGLTVIANAPNPAGYGILNASLGKEGISSLQLFFKCADPHAYCLPLLLALILMESGEILRPIRYNKETSFKKKGQIKPI